MVPSFVPTIAWYVTEVAVALVTETTHTVPFPQVAMTVLPAMITMYHGVDVMSWLAVAVILTEVPAVTLVAVAAIVTPRAGVQATVTVGEVALTVVTPSFVPTTAWYVTEAAVALVTETAHDVPFPQVAMTWLLLSRITMYHTVVVMSWLAVAVSVTGVLGVTLVALAASVTESAGAEVQVTVTVGEGRTFTTVVTPSFVPTTALYVTAVAVALVTETAHDVPFPQVVMTLLLPSRITMYHGVVVTSWLAVAVSVTETPVATLVALAASVTESAGAEVQVTVTGEEVALTVVTPSCVPTTA